MKLQDVAFTLAGRQFTFEQVAEEFSTLHTTHELYKDEREGLGVHFILMCKGKDLAQFLTITTMVEQAKGWKTKQNETGTVKSPDAWKQYKSNAKKFLEYNGSFDQISTVSELNKALQKVRAEKAEQGSSDQAIETATKAIEVAAGNSQSFANMLAKLAGMYGSLTPGNQEIMEQELGDLVQAWKDYSVDDEIAELLAEQVEEEAAKVA